MKTTFNFLIILTLMLLSNIVYSQSVPSYVPTNGLVGWWGFNGNAQDGSGNGNHGTVNGATLTTDRFGNQNGAYDFDGNNTIVVPHSQNLNLGNFTISAWVFLPNLNSGNIYEVLTKGCDLYENYELLIYNNGDVETAIRFTDGSRSHTSNGLLSVSSSNWHYIITTYDITTGYLRSYINGQPNWVIFLNNRVPINNSSSLLFGSDCGFRYFNGKLDDIGIWNRALTPQEITNLYNSQLPTQTSLCLPTITTSSPTSVGIDSVVIGGNITNDGGSAIVLRGVCYSTSPNPNMGNQRTEDGSGIGSFNTVLRGLNPSTTYYARSYAKNSNGVVVYGNEVSFSTAPIAPIIGSNYAGGIVFYVDSTGQHGLVCAPSDQGNFQWGCYGTDIVGTSTAFGTGQANTTAIVNGCSARPIAASVCDDLVLNGYSDWYLPSIDELSLMYSNLHVQGFGGYSNAWYYSSSQNNAWFWGPSRNNPYTAWSMYFGNGYANLGYYKNDNGLVRAVRAF